MRRRATHFVLAIVGLVAVGFAAAFGVSAQKRVAASRTIDDPRATEEVLAVDADIWDAATKCDSARWASHVADDFVLVSSIGTLMNKAQLGAVCTYEWKMQTLKVFMYGNSVVVVGNHFYRKKGTDPKLPLEVHLYTRLYEKRNGKWLWVYGHHQHAEKPLPPYETALTANAVAAPVQSPNGQGNKSAPNTKTVRQLIEHFVEIYNQPGSPVYPLYGDHLDWIEMPAGRRGGHDELMAALRDSRQILRDFNLKVLSITADADTGVLEGELRTTDPKTGEVRPPLRNLWFFKFAGDKIVQQHEYSVRPAPPKS